VEIIRDIEGLDGCQGGTCVLTMGALHEGHLSLIRGGVALDCHPVVTTIFVNPTQFGEGEDLSRYPRPIEKDISCAEEAGTDILFLPSVEVIYPGGVEGAYQPKLPSVAVDPGLEEAHRPGHFAGVCMVVYRFFELLQPRYAMFGEKDYQQLLVIREMVRNEGLGIEVVGCPIVRDADGLALSSRNVYLNEEERERERALGLSRALTSAGSCPIRSIEEGELIMRGVLHSHDVEIDYAVIRDCETLLPVDGGSVKRDENISNNLSLRALIAGRVGGTRLIDNGVVVLGGE